MKQLVLLLTVMLAAFPGVELQAQRHYFLAYSVNEGLAQSQVRDIVQSEDGYLWIATVGGISRFDGIHFTTYNKSNGLLNNLTNTLFPASNGTMVASCPGGLVMFNGHQITAHPFDSSYENVLINDLLAKGETYILGSNGRGILYFENGKITGELDLGSNNRNFIRSLSKSGNNLLAGTKDGLILVRPDGSSEVLNDTISVNDIIEGDNVQWIATNGDGLFAYENGTLRRYSKPEGLINRFLRDLTLDHEGNPWILSKNSIQVLDLKTDTFREIKSYNDEQTANMKVIYADSERNIWIGTDGFGILRFTGADFELYSTEDGLSSNIVMDIDQDKDGSYYFATYGYGVVHKSEHTLDTITDRNGLSNLTVWSLLVKEDELWMGTSDGIQVLKNKKVSPHPANANLPFPRVSNLFEDSDGLVWICTRDGVAVWDGDTLNVPPSIEAFEMRDCKGVIEYLGYIWITSNTGLLRYANNGDARKYGLKDGMPEEYITCISEGNKDDLWLGSEEGLLHFDHGNNTWSQTKLSDKVSSNIINFLENQHNEYLWIGTDNGLFRLDLRAYYEDGITDFKAYNKYDGIISNECNQNASFTDDEGNVWFGTNGGLLRHVKSKETASNSSVIAVNIHDIQQNFESVLDDVKAESSDAGDNVFKYGENRLTFRYSAIHFTNPDKVVYSHRLHDSGEDWSPETQENYITYSSLSPGEYTFEVRARIAPGPWVETSHTFHFYIAPPYWMRWWFIMAVAIASVLILWFVIYQYRKQELRKRQLADMRTKARVLGLEQQTLNAHMNRHFIFNALNSIQYYINTQDRRQANQYLTNFASLVRKNLDSAQLESITLNEELERLKLYVNLEQMRFKDRFSFTINIDPSLDPEQIQVPSMILQPYVENSIMHGILPSNVFGEISVSILPHPAGIKVVVDDNGIGIETSVQSKNGTSHHVSNGMKITKQRIEIMAKAFNSEYGVVGPYEVLNAEQVCTGTRVEIVLPKNFQQFRQLYEIKA